MVDQGAKAMKGCSTFLYNITGASPSDCLVLYPRHSLGAKSYLSTEVQSVYSTTPADWAKQYLNFVPTLRFSYIYIYMCVCVCVCVCVLDVNFKSIDCCLVLTYMMEKLNIKATNANYYNFNLDNN